MAYQPIDNYGLIGDLHTVALVGVNGSIDWLSMPRFNSPSVFAAILDDAKGGRFRIAPANEDGITSRTTRSFWCIVAQWLYSSIWNRAFQGSRMASKPPNPFISYTRSDDANHGSGVQPAVDVFFSKWSVDGGKSGDVTTEVRAHDLGVSGASEPLPRRPYTGLRPFEKEEWPILSRA